MPESMRPVEAIIRAAESGVQLAVATLLAEARLPLLDRIEELEAEVASLRAENERIRKAAEGLL